MKTALVTGVTGQDASYLVEYLNECGYRVVGTARRALVGRLLESPLAKVHDVCYADMTDGLSLETAIRKYEPDEIYNLAAQPFVPPSWTRPAETFNVNVGGLARIMHALEQTSMRHTRVYQASSTEMFGESAACGVLDESTPMKPLSPYGASKLAAHELCRVYRKKGFYVVSGICGNHESPRRGLEMVTRKISFTVAGWKVRGEQPVISLGNVSARRDWGFAGDYVRAMHAMLQQDEPKDYLIGTGEGHSVEEFLHLAAQRAGIREFQVLTNDRFVRPNEIPSIVVNAENASRELNWQPECTFQELVEMMVDSDIKLLES